MTTSTLAARRSSRSRPACCSRSKVIPRLLVLKARNRVPRSGWGSPPTKGGSCRAWSPQPGGSTFRVSAPWSATSLAQYAPERLLVNSNTFMSSNIPTLGASLAYFNRSWLSVIRSSPFLESFAGRRRFRPNQGADSVGLGRSEITPSAIKASMSESDIPAMSRSTLTLCSPRVAT